MFFFLIGAIQIRDDDDDDDKLVPECCHSGSYWRKDDGARGDNWS